MYSLPAELGGVELDPGRSLLIVGPPGCGKRQVAFDVLTTGSEAGEGAIVVTTEEHAEGVLERYCSLLGRDLEGLDVGIVDCVSCQQGREGSADDRVSYVASPADLTAVGIAFSELLTEFDAARDTERTRVMFDSITAPLLASGPETVFRFLHVFTGRVRSVGGLGAFVIDSSAHDDRTMGTVRELFDGVVEITDGADPDPSLPDLAD